MEAEVDLAKLDFVESTDNIVPNPRSAQAISMSPAPNDPPWNTPAAIGAWFASVVLILVIPNLFLVPYLLTQNISWADTEGLTDFLLSDPTSVLLNIGGIIPAHALTLVLAWLVVTRFRRFPFRQTLGWDRGGFVWWHYVLILAAFFLIAGVIGSYYPQEQNQLLRILQSSRAAVYLVAFMATFTAPIVEEVIYRGILYSAFQRTFSAPIAVVFVTFLFALVHVPQYLPSYSTIFLLTLLSLILTLVRAWSGNLLPCIILHFLFNGIQSITLILQPWIETPPVKPVAPAVHIFSLFT